MKKLLVGAALGLGLMAGPGIANAVEFNAQGEWFFGYGAVESSFINNNNGDTDVFNAQQRIRMQIDAVVSESLMGVISFEIGDTVWGQQNAGGVGDGGGALGADGRIIGIRDAYIDWMLPSTNLMFRMGLQAVATPNAAGGSAIIDDQVAAVVASFQASENFGVTAFWLRPFNDNYIAGRDGNDPRSNYLDNADYFGISVPVKANGFEVTPWAMVGFVGKNTVNQDGDRVFPDPTSRAYGTQYYFGLPIVFNGMAPFNMEFDINYGYSEDMLAGVANSQASGWVVKGLFEYALEWGTPGILGWYASGEDDSDTNGSERMPTISPTANATSFMQDGSNGWSVGNGYGLSGNDYSGTWALGLQIRDMSFMEDLSHSLRVVYWGGTNHDSNVRGMYGDPENLTTSDYLVEVNVDTSYAIYENLTAIVELGYIFNGIDMNNSGDSKRDAWKAALIMKYEF